MSQVSGLARQIADHIEETRRIAEEEVEMFELAEFSENAKVTITARVPEHTLFLVDCIAAQTSATRSALAADLIENAVSEVYGELVAAGLLKPMNDQETIAQYVKWLEEKRS